MEKYVKFNQLVANCVILQNVLDMSQALRELIEEGYPVNMKAVQGLSAYPMRMCGGMANMIWM